MKKQYLERLDKLIKIIPDLLIQINKNEFDLKPSPDKWSKKEILGHLIDSATNNHHRFIRAQYEDMPRIAYNQNQWNKLNHYIEMDSTQIITFWTIYNKHLLEIMKRIPNENLQKECISTDEKIYTIEYLMNDYVKHLEYHLHQIVNY
jgi:hypothetical protein